MAAVVHRLTFAARRSVWHVPRRTRPTRLTRAIRPSLRPFTSTSIALQDEDDDDDDDGDIEIDDDELVPAKRPEKFVDTLSDEARAHYESLSDKDKQEYETTMEALDRHMTSREVDSLLSAAVSQAAHEVQMADTEPDTPPPRIKPGFFAMGEEDEQGSGADEDEVFNNDDISSLGHAELEQHREFREYARIAAWEMPLLSSAFTTNPA